MSQYAEQIKEQHLKNIYLAYRLQHEGIFFHKTKLDFVDFYLLRTLAQYPQSIKTLCRQTEIGRKDVTKRVNKYLKAGFLAKKTLDCDKRSFLLCLTEVGENANRAGNKKIAEMLNVATSRLSLKDEKSVIKYLEDFNKALLEI